MRLTSINFNLHLLAVTKQMELNSLSHISPLGEVEFSKKKQLVPPFWHRLVYSAVAKAVRQREQRERFAFQQIY